MPNKELKIMVKMLVTKVRKKLEKHSGKTKNWKYKKEQMRSEE